MSTMRDEMMEGRRGEPPPHREPPDRKPPKPEPEEKIREGSFPESNVVNSNIGGRLNGVAAQVMKFVPQLKMIKARHVLAVMGFLGMFNVYTLRTNLNIAIVAMVNQTYGRDVGGNVTDICPDHGYKSDSSTLEGTFDWSYKQYTLALGCYFYGYIFSNIPGAWLARTIGFKKVLGVSMFFSTIITFLTPLAVNNSFGFFVFMRVVLGFLQGVSFPAMQGAWGVWAPPLERSFLVSVHVAGASFGNVVTAPLAGYIAKDYGWEYVFYITGVIALLWTIIWFLVVHDSPEEHPRISEEERHYIISTIKMEKKKATQKRITPWCEMLKSPPLFAILCGHFASNWGNYTLLTLLPTYMTHILKFDIKSSGLLTALPFVLQLIVAVGGGKLTDKILESGKLSVIQMRKLNTTIGLLVPAISIVIAGYVGCNWQVAMAFFTISVALNALTIPGCKANTLDIAPRYAGILYGISNTFANIPGFLAPQVVGIFLDYKDGSISQWQLSFWVVAIVYMVGAIVYLLFGSGEEQSWAKGRIVENSELGDAVMVAEMETFKETED